MEKKYKVIFFADELQSHTQLIKERLASEFSCFSSTNIDEYHQVFNQSGKFVLLFSDARNALGFRINAAENLSSLEYEILVYLHTDVAFKADSQKLLDQNNVKVFRVSDAEVLIAHVHTFLAGKDHDPTELEFYMPPDNPQKDEDKDGTPVNDQREALSRVRRLRKHARNGH